MTQKQDDNEVLRFRISETCIASIRLAGEVTQEAIDKLLAFLELMRDTFPLDTAPKSG